MTFIKKNARRTGSPRYDSASNATLSQSQIPKKKFNRFQDSAEKWVRDSVPTALLPMRSQLLHTIARETIFLIWECSALRKLSIPSDWRIQSVNNETTLVQTAHAAIQGGDRLLVLIPQEHWEAVDREIAKRLVDTLRLGVLVVAQDTLSLLSRPGPVPYFFDVIGEKDFKRSTEFFLLRCLRHMAEYEGRVNPKVDQKILEKLNQIFIELSAERNLQRLLANIVVKAMEVAGADAGILYLVSEADGDMIYRMKVESTGGSEITIEHISSRVVENSLCGYVALTGKLLNLSSPESVRALTLPQASRSIDFGQDAGNFVLLTIPLKNSRNEITAVLQLARRRIEGENSFGSEEEAVLNSFATQAAICLENVDLYADIQRLFDGFVKASIAAIESRDPSTGGHSERVAIMTVALAKATTECNTGIYRSVKFRVEEIRELEYAALLHDFGKIGIREEVLVKAKKLYPHQLDAIRDRIRLALSAAKISLLEKNYSEEEYRERVKELKSYWGIILEANEPTILPQKTVETLHRIRHEKIPTPDGALANLLTEEEYEALAVTQGSLTESERLEIESHVRHTYQFLKMIPWTKDFRHLTEIAYCHHEKLDGSGYPRGLTAHEIPLQSKIMTIADIYDALTAADRWYKEAVPAERALDILREEVSQGKLDPVLFDIFIEKKIYLLTQSERKENVA